MVELNDLKRIINNRVIIVMLHGRSIEQLENTILELKDLDICYCSLNYFTIMEDFILSKINESLDFVYDSSFIKGNCLQDFNEKARIPRLRRFLNRKEDNLWLTTSQVIKSIMFQVGNEEFILRYIDKIFLVQKKLNLDLEVPSSMLPLLGSCIIGEARKIILCGFDGYKEGNKLESYYKPELQRIDKILSGQFEIPNIEVETSSIMHLTEKILNKYAKQHKVKVPEIINCSENSVFTMFPKIKYSLLRETILK